MEFITINTDKPKMAKPTKHPDFELIQTIPSYAPHIIEWAN
jgi:hypothetical protein